ncbi:DUF1569 domain-containing protein [Tundrisphaera lichenicola]|uniref:DUF1569 domain-containing protein n=1 Tax=Tundrisphaera lichenicola TaxID=2029860 RepID=UPI003EBF8B2A
MAGQRDLSFERIDQIMPEVDRLLVGHTTTGSWTLGQILYHLATSVRLSALGNRTSALDPDPESRANRASAVARKRFFKAGRFPEGYEAPISILIPPTDADDQAEAGSLRSALRRFEEREGEFPAHPMLGPLTKEEWEAFHRIHAGHHLGFVRPR